MYKFPDLSLPITLHKVTDRRRPVWLGRVELTMTLLNMHELVRYLNLKQETSQSGDEIKNVMVLHFTKCQDNNNNNYR